MFDAIDRFNASEQVLEVLNHALAEIEDIHSDDLALKELYRNLERLTCEYERHHKISEDEAEYYEDEQAGLTDIDITEAI